MRTPEQIAKEIAETATLSDKENEDGYYEPIIEDFDQLALFIEQGIDAYRSERETDAAPAFQPEGEPDKYRDLWAENMPRVSGRMYFAIPGEQALHVNDDQARRILEMLSSEA